MQSAKRATRLAAPVAAADVSGVPVRGGEPNSAVIAALAATGVLAAALTA
jgi:hypothetical protein